MCHSHGGDNVRNWLIVKMPTARQEGYRADVSVCRSCVLGLGPTMTKQDHDTYFGISEKLDDFWGEEKKGVRKENLG